MMEKNRYFLPSEIARLVLGYLKQENCMQAYKCFLKESSNLAEYASLLNHGLDYPTSLLGKTLVDMIQEYGYLKLRDSQALVQSQPSSHLWQQFDDLVGIIKQQVAPKQHRRVPVQTKKGRPKLCNTIVKVTKTDEPVNTTMCKRLPQILPRGTVNNISSSATIVYSSPKLLPKTVAHVLETQDTHSDNMVDVSDDNDVCFTTGNNEDSEVMSWNDDMQVMSSQTPLHTGHDRHTGQLTMTPNPAYSGQHCPPSQVLASPCPVLSNHQVQTATAIPPPSPVYYDQQSQASQVILCHSQAYNNNQMSKSIASPSPASIHQQAQSVHGIASPSPASINHQAQTVHGIASPSPASINHQAQTVHGIASPSPASINHRAQTVHGIASPSPASINHQAQTVHGIASPSPASIHHQAQTVHGIASPRPASMHHQAQTVHGIASPSPASIHHQAQTVHGIASPSPASMHHQAQTVHGIASPSPASIHHQAQTVHGIASPNPASINQQAQTVHGIASPRSINNGHQTQSIISSPSLVFSKHQAQTPQILTSLSLQNGSQPAPSMNTASPWPTHLPTSTSDKQDIVILSYKPGTKADQHKEQNVFSSHPSSYDRPDCNNLNQTLTENALTGNNPRRDAGITGDHSENQPSTQQAEVTNETKTVSSENKTIHQPNISHCENAIDSFEQAKSIDVPQDELQQDHSNSHLIFPSISNYSLSGLKTPSKTAGLYTPDDMSLITPTKTLQETESNKGRSPRRKRFPPRKRSFGTGANIGVGKSGIVRQTICENTNEAKPSSSYTIDEGHVGNDDSSDITPFVEEILKNAELQQRLAENINRRLHLSDNTSVGDNETSVPVASVSNTQPFTPNQHSLDDILDLNETKMSGDVITSIIDTIKDDPAFNTLFQLFETDAGVDEKDGNNSQDSLSSQLCLQLDVEEKRQTETDLSDQPTDQSDVTFIMNSSTDSRPSFRFTGMSTEEGEETIKAASSEESDQPYNQSLADEVSDVNTEMQCSTSQSEIPTVNIPSPCEDSSSSPEENDAVSSSDIFTSSQSSSPYPRQRVSPQVVERQRMGPRGDQVEGLCGNERFYIPGPAGDCSHYYEMVLVTSSEDTASPSHRRSAHSSSRRDDTLGTISSGLLALCSVAGLQDVSNVVRSSQTASSTGSSTQVSPVRNTLLKPLPHKTTTQPFPISNPPPSTVRRSTLSRSDVIKKRKATQKKIKHIPSGCTVPCLEVRYLPDSPPSKAKGRKSKSPVRNEKMRIGSAGKITPNTRAVSKRSPQTEVAQKVTPRRSARLSAKKGSLGKQMPCHEIDVSSPYFSSPNVPSNTEDSDPSSQIPWEPEVNDLRVKPPNKAVHKKVLDFGVTVHVSSPVKEPQRPKVHVRKRNVCDAFRPGKYRLLKEVMKDMPMTNKTSLTPSKSLTSTPKPATCERNLVKDSQQTTSTMAMIELIQDKSKSVPKTTNTNKKFFNKQSTRSQSSSWKRESYQWGSKIHSQFISQIGQVGSVSPVIRTSPTHLNALSIPRVTYPFKLSQTGDLAFVSDTDSDNKSKQSYNPLKALNQPMPDRSRPRFKSTAVITTPFKMYETSSEDTESDSVVSEDRQPKTIDLETIDISQLSQTHSHNKSCKESLSKRPPDPSNKSPQTKRPKHQ